MISFEKERAEKQKLKEQKLEEKKVLEEQLKSINEQIETVGTGTKVALLAARTKVLNKISDYEIGEFF